MLLPAICQQAAAAAAAVVTLPHPLLAAVRYFEVNGISKFPTFEFFFQTRVFICADFFLFS